MLAYLVRRLLLFVPTLFGIMVVNFIIVQAAPGGPVELMISRLRGHAVEATARVGGSGGGETARGPERRPPASGTDKYRGARGIDPELIRQLERQYGFDRPAPERFVRMIRSYLAFDFGSSFYRDRRVIDLIVEKLPVSISLGLWTTLLIYLVSIPLGIAKAVRDGSPFDVWTSGVVIVGYAIPSFLFAILLIVLFAGGSFLDWFPLRGLTSDHWRELCWPPASATTSGTSRCRSSPSSSAGFATLTMLTKNSFLEEINKQYVDHRALQGPDEAPRALRPRLPQRDAARRGGLSRPPSSASCSRAPLLIEVIFSLDGLGLLGFEAAINRDYPIMFGTLYIYTIVGLLLTLISDLTYVAVDPRIDFASRET